jgi:gamma-glutamyl hydrolase
VLSDFYKVLATSRDRQNTEYVAMIEADSYPIYGTQFHPEKNLYEWNEAPIPHSLPAVEVANYLGTFFVNEARMNAQKFDSVEDLKSKLIYKYDAIYVDTYFVQIYGFY